MAQHQPHHHAAGPPAGPTNTGPGYPPPPAQPRRKSRLPLLLAITAVALLAVCGGFGVLLYAAAGTATTPAPAGTVGQPVRDGDLEFVVRGHTCGRTAYSGIKPLGIYCEVRVEIRNVGKESQLFAESSQTAYDVEGRKYTSDTAAAIYANESNQVWLRDINPGQKATGLVIFDVPVGTRLDRIELHDSILSRGVVVKLS